ncbi:MAG: hypothetical protein MMC23_007218 [Stictis urceolatum]|nr:hypothetical protein [Stictis urceolata]
MGEITTLNPTDQASSTLTSDIAPPNTIFNIQTRPPSISSTTLCASFRPQTLPKPHMAPQALAPFNPRTASSQPNLQRTSPRKTMISLPTAFRSNSSPYPRQILIPVNKLFPL